MVGCLGDGMMGWCGGWAVEGLGGKMMDSTSQMGLYPSMNGYIPSVPTRLAHCVSCGHFLYVPTIPIVSYNMYDTYVFASCCVVVSRVTRYVSLSIV